MATVYVRKVDEDVYAQLAQLALDRHQSISAVIREALAAYVDWARR